MSKRKESKINVTGLSVKEILSMDVNKLSESDMRKVTTRLVSAANKRLRRLAAKEEGKTSPAFRNAQRSGKPFSAAGKDRNQLYAELARMRDFMRDKTSSLSGWKKVRKAGVERLGERLGEKVSEDEAKRFWDLVGKAQEMGGIAVVPNSEELQSLVYDSMTENADDEDAILDLQEKLDDLYESIEEEAPFDDDDDGGFYSL